VPRVFINHGLSNVFLSQGLNAAEESRAVKSRFFRQHDPARPDRPIFLQIIRENPEIIFECWGSYKPNESNIGGQHDQSAKEFIADLSKQSNVILHGAVSPSLLRKGFDRMDAFLICYDVVKDLSNGTNYHKVIEFLCTGKVVISSNITTYQSQPELIQMVPERDTNANLPSLFKKVMSGLDEYNAEPLQEKRIIFSEENSYERQIKRIDKLLAQLNILAV
jgi:hypothetical protein